MAEGHCRGNQPQRVRPAGSATTGWELCEFGFAAVPPPLPTPAPLLPEHRPDVAAPVVVGAAVGALRVTALAVDLCDCP